MRTACEILDGAIASAGDVRERIATFPTGFEPLDHVLGGGFRPQELVLLGGRPGVGKTIAALQWARWNALRGHTSLYVCYEHAPEILLGRLFALELGSIVRSDELTHLDGLRLLAQEVVLGSGRVDTLLAHPLGEEALGRVRSYGDRLRLVQASGKGTGVAELEDVVIEGREGSTIMFVDYLQKVATGGGPVDPEARVTSVAESLKDLAMNMGIAVVAISAADKLGFETRRVQLRHLRGSAVLGHECDVALLMNEKAIAVSKTHSAYDPVRAEAFKRQVVFSVEKNRGGPAGLDVEFHKDFGSYRFDPDGAFVAEKLVDDVLTPE